MDSVFREATADPRTQAVPLSHVSMELGHLYMEDFAAGRERLRRQLGQVKPWADALHASLAGSVPKGRPRVSSCFLVDDYFSPFASPAEVLPPLLDEARRAGLTIDYLARESACARARGVEPARSVEPRLVESPPPGSDGSRPSVRQVGWLANGERSPATGSLEAMSGFAAWQPPSEVGARRHSIFVDVELWDGHGADRTWSCPFLAAVWQLTRLGLLRDRGEPVLRPSPWSGDFPEEWAELPPLLQLNPAAAPFAAYRTYSILPTRFLPVEHAVHIVLGRVVVEEAVLRQVAERSAREGVEVPAEIVRRTSYHFFDEP
ncbi:SCO2522 family protein [Streptomyces sp. NPDC050610]|uniref:SCO2522 family protein n=1 Tax=Streptomyces sp. NPDC050610 TaxID=3157097 RepID=UPI003442944F